MGGSGDRIFVDTHRGCEEAADKIGVVSVGASRDEDPTHRKRGEGRKVGFQGPDLLGCSHFDQEVFPTATHPDGGNSESFLKPGRNRRCLSGLGRKIHGDAGVGSGTVLQAAMERAASGFETERLGGGLTGRFPQGVRCCERGMTAKVHLCPRCEPA
jgi:hypothetical protein